jgi:hypothetical protein
MAYALPRDLFNISSSCECAKITKWMLKQENNPFQDVSRG